MRVIKYFVVSLLGVMASPRKSVRIIGGSETSITDYPHLTSLSIKTPFGSLLSCSGFIINENFIMSAAHCFYYSSSPSIWQVRVGSELASSGGTVHEGIKIIMHPDYNSFTLENDLGVLRLTVDITFGVNIKPATYAGPSHHLPDDEEIWAVGWGLTTLSGSTSEILNHVQVYAINQDTCRESYARINLLVTDTMLCSGWYGVGGKDQCNGDSGGPLMHKTDDGDLVVGVCSWSYLCAQPEYPGVNVRISNYTDWIESVTTIE